MEVVRVGQLMPAYLRILYIYVQSIYFHDLSSCACFASTEPYKGG